MRQNPFALLDDSIVPPIVTDIAPSELHSVADVPMHNARRHGSVEHNVSVTVRGPTGLEHPREVRHVAMQDEEVLALLRVLLASVDPTLPGPSDLVASLLRHQCMVHDEIEIERLRAIFLTSAEETPARQAPESGGEALGVPNGSAVINEQPSFVPSAHHDQSSEEAGVPAPMHHTVPRPAEFGTAIEQIRANNCSTPSR